MPEPIIALQRRLALVGAIRAGGEKPQRGVGRKLESWRLTSPRRELVEQAAALYGGPVTPWQGPNGAEFQVYTTAEELPVLLMPSYSLRQTYELWEGVTKRLRLCDGVDEELTGQPCVCNAEGNDRCDIYTRLVVALPELDTVLGWRVITRGANAAHELPTMVALAEQTGRGQTFVPARLRIAQRRGVVDGQVARYVVPTLDLDVSYLSLTGRGRPALASGDVVDEETRMIEQPALVGGSPATAVATRPRRRAAAEFGPDVVDVADVKASEPPPEPPEHADVDERQTKALTDAQATKLNVLVGKLRDQGGHLTTESLYAAIGKLRRISATDLLALIPDAVDSLGTPHWAPLRKTLNRAEANQLIDWLVEKETRVKAASAGSRSTPEPTSVAYDVESTPASAVDSEPERPASVSDVPPASGAVPYDEFPDGY